MRSVWPVSPVFSDSLAWRALPVGTVAVVTRAAGATAPATGTTASRSGAGSRRTRLAQLRLPKRHNLSGRVGSLPGRWTMQASEGIDRATDGSEIYVIVNVMAGRTIQLAFTERQTVN